ncbi:MAG: phosphatidylethanolamine-binding protein [Clostridia bacterium]|nr:phosphatidylethanolamine-binding protein [Clostridia bacterium]
MRRIFAAILAAIMMFTLAACSNETPSGNNIATMYDSFELTSESLVKGKWDNEISNTDKGKNVSPDLKWEPVEGAKCYVIYMVDSDMQYFMHWKADGVTETSLSKGWATKDYVGPYPPKGGKHTYDIYVFALKNDIPRLKGAFNSQNQKFPSFIEAIDTDVDGNTGNVISCGYLSGTFKN